MNHKLPRQKRNIRNLKKFYVLCKSLFFLLAFVACLFACKRQVRSPQLTPSLGATQGPIPGDSATCQTQDDIPCPPGLSCMAQKACSTNKSCDQQGTCHLRCSERLPCPEGFFCQPFPTGQACIKTP